jgi:hypothetical protein
LQSRTLQRGAATLVVVMVLFFIISMVAAYTSRNMIFEQRTGANLYRGTQAIEAAEAGMEWALMLMNTGRIDTACTASTATTDDTFRQRYASINTSTGFVIPRTGPTTGVELTPTCVFDSATGRWVCDCPTDGAPTLVAPTGVLAPAFRVRLRALSSSINRPGMIRIEVVGCTRLDNNCLTSVGTSLANEGRARLTTVAFLGSNSSVKPLAALTARGAISATGLTVSNARVSDGGITIHASGAIDPSATPLLTTLAGNALSGSTISPDASLDLPALGGFSARERFFASLFQLPPARWVQQPAVVVLDCGSTACTAATLRDAIEQNPQRPLWINGSVDVDSSGDIGSATAPVTLIINGNLVFTTAGVTIHGLIVLRPVDVTTGWALSGSGRLVGAVVVDGAVTGGGSMQIEYDGSVLDAARYTHGSFVRLPGSWRDW